MEAPLNQNNRSKKYRDKVNTFKKQILAIQELILFLVKITAVIRKECNECNSYMQQIKA